MDIRQYMQLAYGRQCHSAVMENNMLAQQAAVLDGYNQKLIEIHEELRIKFNASQEEIKKLGEHMRNIKTEEDKEIGDLLDRIAKAESRIHAGESIKRELAEAQYEVQNLAATRDELTSQMRKRSQELDEARSDIKMLPEMVVERDSLRKEHTKLLRSFKWKKRSNKRQVKQMKLMERHLVNMVEEVETLRAKLFIALREQDDPSHLPPPTHGSMNYLDQNDRPCDTIRVVAAGEGRSRSLSSGDSDSSDSCVEIESNLE